MGQIFNEYTSLELHLTESLIQCCSEYSGHVNVNLALGRIVGTDNRERIFLPVASDCLLEQSKEYNFIEEVPSSVQEIICTQLLPSAVGSWEIEGGGDIYSVEYYFDDDVTVAVQALSSWDDGRDASGNYGEEEVRSETERRKIGEDNTLQYIRVAHLGELHLYRPQSDLHMKISFVSHRPTTLSSILESSEETLSTSYNREGSKKQNKISRAVRRRLMTWRFIPRSQDGPDWILTIGESYELTPPSSIQEVTKSWLESETDGLDPVATLRVTANPELVFHLYNLSPQDSKQGLSRLIRELVEHGRTLANLLYEPLEPRTYYYPAYFGDIAAQSRKHYNLKQAKGLAVARASKIEALRKLNNEIKRCLIEDYVPLKSSVLDLACGHGQDILKYLDKKLTQFVGIDISSEEIREAGRRLMADQFITSFPWQFHVGNLLQEKAYDPIKNQVFDVVSLQLAIHYCMATEKQAEDLFRHIFRQLKPGGIFIGSTGDCDTIAERIFGGVYSTTVSTQMSTNSPISFWFGNSIYTVTFGSAMMEKVLDGVACIPPPISTGEIPSGPQLIVGRDNLELLLARLNTEWGIKYSFWLTEHIDAEEYVVPWKAFCSVAAKYGLQLIMNERFDRFFAHQLTKNRRLQQWKKNQLEKIRFDERQVEAFSFYKVFAFRKLHTGQMEGTVAEPNTFLNPSSFTSRVPHSVESSPSLGELGVFCSTSSEVNSQQTGSQIRIRSQESASFVSPPALSISSAKSCQAPEDSSIPSLTSLGCERIGELPSSFHRPTDSPACTDHAAFRTNLDLPDPMTSNSDSDSNDSSSEDSSESSSSTSSSSASSRKNYTPTSCNTVESHFN